ncbi:MAG: 23S rRNA (pseudouridine(1915)-N(3))-methyltransferase RlmH [Spirochaetaceae bacterium]|nr:23S rRNA (pseudouridine(1915)-N(3))-methyltransferase RlmH [Spirochaetaceae bacterium]
MKVTVMAAGKIKESWISEGITEFTKRLRRFVNLSIIEITDEKVPESYSEKQISQAVEREGRKMLDRWPSDALGIAMDPGGRSVGSEGLAKLMDRWAVNGTSHLVFVIGGSNGISPEVVNLCREKISFGPHVFPHQLFRVMLLEQIYRARKIIAKEPYHK